MIDTDEAHFIEQLKSGEQSAFRNLVKKYHSGLVYIAKLIVGEAFAEEIVQDTWETVLTSIPSFQQRSTIKTWITQIVINKAKTRKRRESRHSSLDMDWQNTDSGSFKANGAWAYPPEPWHEDSPEALLSSDQLRDNINLQLNKLPDKQRLALVLYDIEGLKFSDICNIIEVSESNVRVLLHRARLTIKNVIDEHQNPL